METMKIAKAEGPDMLRWGYRIKGMFTIKEGYQLQAEHFMKQKTNIWESIWQEKTWAKVTFLMSILRHGLAITWDQLQKKRVTRTLNM